VRLKAELKGALLALLGVALVAVGAWIASGIRLGLWTYHEYRRYLYITDNIPVAYHLWHGHIKAGTDVETLLAEWRPDRTARFGRWVEMTWFPGGLRKDSFSLIGVTILAEDGALAEAAFWADDGLATRVFFNTMTPEALTEYQAAHKAYVDDLVSRRKKEAPQDGAANGSQPTRSETNSKPSAAGSGHRPDR
jgi:hypothetical protein